MKRVSPKTRRRVTRSMETFSAASTVIVRVVAVVDAIRKVIELMDAKERTAK